LARREKKKKKEKNNNKFLPELFDLKMKMKFFVLEIF